jgi:hypothetical protein
MTLAHDPVLGRIKRNESPQELRTSTYQRVREAILANRHQLARDYIGYFHEEALVCWQLYDQWLAYTRKYFVLKGLGEEEFSTAHARVVGVIAPRIRAPSRHTFTSESDCQSRPQISRSAANMDRLPGELAAA